MKCPKCKMEMPNNMKCCMHCGHLLEAEQYLKEEISEYDKYLNYFTQNKTQRELQRKYLFLNFFYLLAEKMFLLATINLIANCVLLFLIVNFFDLLFGFLGFNFLFLVFAVLFCVYLNYNIYKNIEVYYMQYAKDAVAKILEKNKDKSKEQLEQLLIKKGSTNYIYMTLPFIFLTLVLLILLNF